MSFVATARAARMRPVATADDSLAAASLFAEAASVDDEVADLAAGHIVDPFEIAEDGSAASFKLYAGTGWDARRTEPIRTLYVSRAPRSGEPGATLYPVKGDFTVTTTVLVPTTAPPEPVTSSATLVIPPNSVPSGEAPPSSSNAIVMTTTILV